MARVYPRVLCAWAAACASAALAAPPDPTPEQLREGERVFRDVYGKEFDRVAKGAKATPAEKVGLGKRLWDAARGAKDDPGLARVLADKALPLALEHPTGYPVALDIRTARVTDGKDRPEQLAAVAAVMERMARADAEKRAALGVSAVELYREASEIEADAGQAAEAANFAARAKAAAQALLPPAQAAAVSRDVNAALAEADAVRRLAAEMAKLKDAVKAKPDDPKANQLLALALLRAGREAEAGKHLAAGPPGKLPALAEHLARTPVDHAKAGNAYRELADDHPADRPALLGLARRHYEAALAADPKHPDAARLRLLAKELPAFRPTGLRVPADAAAVVDENPAVAGALGRGTGTAKVEWAARDGLAGGGCLKVAPGKAGEWDWRAFADEGLIKLPVDGVSEYRFAGFAYRQVGGTRAVVQFYSAAGPVGPRLLIGPADGAAKTVVVADKPAEEWAVVTRDLFADNGSAPATVSGLVVGTDGELYLDAVYLAKNHRQRDLRRVYTVLGVGPGKPKP
jgi:hypothetical protein